MGRVPLHERDLQTRFKELAKGSAFTLASSIPERSFCPVHCALGDALSQRLGPPRLRVASGGADARPIRAPAVRRFHWRRDSSGTMRGPWTKASSRCFRSRPARCSGAGARPPSRCPTRASLLRPAAVARRAGGAGRRLDQAGLVLRSAGHPKAERSAISGGSRYRQAFRQGAILVPRMLCFVERKKLGRLGGDLGAPHVSSRRQSGEGALEGAALDRKQSRGSILEASAARGKRSALRLRPLNA